jgi:hypothetical protein
VYVAVGLFLANRVGWYNWEITRVLLGFFAECVTFFISQLATTNKFSIQTGLISGVIVLTFMYGMNLDMYRFLGSNFLITLSLLFYPALLLFSIHNPFVRQFLSIRPLTF